MRREWCARIWMLCGLCKRAQPREHWASEWVGRERACDAWTVESQCSHSGTGLVGLSNSGIYMGKSVCVSEAVMVWWQGPCRVRCLAPHYTCCVTHVTTPRRPSRCHLHIIYMCMGQVPPFKVVPNLAGDGVALCYTAITGCKC